MAKMIPGHADEILIDVRSAPLTASSVNTAGRRKIN